MAVTQGISSAFERRLVTSTMAVKPVSIVSQSSSEPGCEAQNEVSRYAAGSFRELVSATVWNEKSWPRMADMNTASATRTAPSIAYTARRADRIRRRSRLRAPTTAVTRRRRPGAARGSAPRGRALPSGHCAEDASPGVYFDGHFVTSESVFASKTPLADLPSTTICRPTLNASGMLPWYTTGIVLLEL